MSNTLSKFTSLIDAVACRDRGNFHLLMLPRLTCLALGGNPYLVDPVTEITQLLCDAIILCDDVIDDDVMPAQWALFSDEIDSLPLARSTAVNVAIGLLSRAGYSIQRLMQAVDNDWVVVLAVQSAFYDTLWRTAAGQQASLMPNPPTLAEAWEIAAIKSGAYFSFACWIGARVSGAGQGAADALRRFGQTLGILIQVGDDMGDLWPRDGKSSDVQAGAWTLPITYALSVLPASSQVKLRHLLTRAASDSAAEEAARRLIIGCGAMVYLHVELDRHYQTARQLLLDTVPSSPYREELLHVLTQTISLLPA